MRTRALVVVSIVVFVLSSFSWAQAGSVQVQTPDQLAKMLPGTVFLDNENVPTQKRNAVLLDIGGKLAVVSLIDTSGYSSAYQQKYSGVILTVGGLELGGKSLPSGTYGFGESKTGDPETGEVTIHVYDIGGKELASIATKREMNMKGVRPLQVIVGSNGMAMFYLGPHYTSIAPVR
jgi:hypothetical protein